MSCPAREELYLHAAGVLDDEAARTLDAHLESGCAPCRDGLEEERRTLAALAEALNPIQPPTRVRERLLARVQERAPGRRAASRPARRRS